MSEGTAQVVVDALLGTPTKIGRLILRPLTLGQYLFLTQIKSPFVTTVNRETDEMDLCRALYALQTPTPDCVALWAKSPDVYERAVLLYMRDVELAELAEMGQKLRAHLEVGFSTALKTRPKDDYNTIQSLEDLPMPDDGMGWIARMVGGLTTLKGWSIHHVLHEVPLAQIFLLWAENALENGHEIDGPGYTDQENLDGWVEAVKALRKPSPGG